MNAKDIRGICSKQCVVSYWTLSSISSNIKARLKKKQKLKRKRKRQVVDKVHDCLLLTVLWAFHN